MKRVTLKDIAAELELSAQTVSLALRGHRRIPAKTRQLVTDAAHRLGYRADPALSALANYRTGHSRSARKWDTIALISNWATPDWWKDGNTYTRLNTALHREAESRGLTLEPHWLGYLSQDAERVFRRIFQRGIRGMIVAPMPSELEPVVIDFPRREFQIVTFGPEHYYPDHHVIQPDFYENLRLAWQKLRAKGHERIGFVYAQVFSWRTSDAWLGAYLAEKRLAGFQANDLQPCMLAEPWRDEKGFFDWLEKEKPDAIITILNQIPVWLRQNSRWNGLAVALLSAQEPGATGINVQPELSARTAVEVLMMEMQRSLVSEQSLPLRIHIPGRWVE